jgi:glycosyltransferase involved in cell wall biosynthesis
MHWNVVAPFIDNVKGRNNTWLTPYVPDKNYQFTCIPRPDKELNWHDRQSATTGYPEWLGLLKQSYTAVRTAEDGVITVLPQLAALVGTQKALLGRRFPIVAWWFNTNEYTGYKRTLARAALQSIDCFVVHNTAEREAYSRWLGLPIERFEFVPLQTPIYPITESEDTENPFVLAIGSAQRDYPLFFEAVKQLGYRTIVVSGSRVLAGLGIPACAETPFGLPKPAIISLLQRARVVVLPMVEAGLVAGTAAIVEALSQGCPLVVSNRRGVEDYIDRLWNDAALRGRLRLQARQYAMQHLTDAVAGANLGRILSQLTESGTGDRVRYSMPRTLL